jgi:hypothetical protein
VDELLTGDLLLRIELEQGADEIPTHVVALLLSDQSTARLSPLAPKKNVGVTHVSRGGHFVFRELYTEVP